MNYKKTQTHFVYLLFVLYLTSCKGVKNISYFQRIEKDNVALINESSNNGFYDVRIKPKDILSITVVSSEPDASKHYNLTVPQIADLNSVNNIYSQPTLQTYLVDNEGKINFPVLGVIKVSGLTSKELETLFQAKLESAFNNERPIITIRFLNYGVNILGEVNRPGRYESTNERLTIFEGLALAGDLSIYGKRDNVKVLREKADGSKLFINMNLNDENIINSEGYFLEQNDVIYVEPNTSKTRTANIGSAENLGISAVSILISMASLIVTVMQ